MCATWNIDWYSIKESEIHLPFDLGGTLMQYVRMPHSWEDFYYKGFEEIIQKFRYPISQDAVEKSFQISRSLKSKQIICYYIRNEWNNEKQI